MFRKKNQNIFFLSLSFIFVHINVFCSQYTSEVGTGQKSMLDTLALSESLAQSDILAQNDNLEKSLTFAQSVTLAHT